MLSARQLRSHLREAGVHRGRPEFHPGMRDRIVGRIEGPGASSMDTRASTLGRAKERPTSSLGYSTRDRSTGVLDDRSDQADEWGWADEDQIDDADAEGREEAGSAAGVSEQRMDGLASQMVDQRVQRERPRRIWMIDPRASAESWTSFRAFLDRIVQLGEPVLIVATRYDRARRARGTLIPAIEKVTAAHPERQGQFTVMTMHWIHGRLTNFPQLRERVMKYRLTPVHEVSYAAHMRFAVHLSPLEGRRKKGRRPGLVIFLNPGDHLVAVREAHHMGIPVAGILNTDFPRVEWVDYPLPGNDRGVKAQLRYMTRRSEAILRGCSVESEKGEKSEKREKREKEATVREES